MSSYRRRFRSLRMRTTNCSRTPPGIRHSTSKRSGGCGLPVSASTTAPQPWKTARISSGSGLAITANTTDSLVVSNRDETPNLKDSLNRVKYKIPVILSSDFIKENACIPSSLCIMDP